MTEHNGCHWAQDQISGRYDYLSMMHYGSFGTFDTKRDRPRLVKHASQLEAGESNEVHMGGSADPAKSGISVLDIVRVAQLYFAGDEKVKAEYNMQSTGWKPYPVQVGRLHTTVMPAETSVLPW